VDARGKESTIRSFVYNGNMNMITPGQVSDSLDVPPSTLRRWAVRFADHLSPQPEGRGHRKYTVADVNTFRKIRDLSAEGVLLDDIADQLDLVDQDQPDQTFDLVTTEAYTRTLDHAVDRIQSHQIAIDDHSQRLTQLESRLAKMDQVNIDHQADELKRLRERLQDYNNLPWLVRIFTKPPTQ